MEKKKTNEYLHEKQSAFARCDAALTPSSFHRLVRKMGTNKTLSSYTERELYDLIGKADPCSTAAWIDTLTPHSLAFFT